MMGYDYHIVKTDHWLDAASNPITKEDVDKLILADKDLKWSQTDYVEIAEEHGYTTRYYAILWHNSPVFWWHKDEIMCSHPSKSQLMKMIEIGNRLQANVVGDDGERYCVKKRFLGRRELCIELMVNNELVRMPYTHE
ncbi:MAG TPA: hypothetical protein PLD25_02780 [Chloroflexota bacterium]|nr:hypothetical protein [Chloroflexota bacterium]